jgi:hypothetical protein
VDGKHIAALGAARDTHREVLALLSDTARLSALRPETDVRWNPEDHGIYWILFAVDGTWAEPLDGWIELCLADRDDWSAKRRGVPAVGAGIALSDEYYEQVRSARLKDWRRDLAAGGVEVGVFDRYVRLWSTRSLTDLPRYDQSRYLAAWLDDTVAFLGRHAPELAGLAQPDGRQRSREPFGRSAHGGRGLG